MTHVVVHVMGWPSRQYGSFERFLTALAARCDEEGARTHLVFPGSPVSAPFVADARADIHAIASPRGPADPRFAARLTPLLRQVGATHVHAHFGVDAYHALAVAGATGARRYATKHITPGTSRRTLSRTRHRWLAGRVERLFAVSRRVGEGLAALGVPPQKIEVCPLGIDAGVYRPDPAARSDVRRELGLDDRAAIVLSTSHLRAGKGVEVFTALAARLGADGRDAVVVAAGGGPLAGQLAADARRLGLPRERLMLLGPRLDVPRLLAAADVFVFPSSGAEGLPLGPLEALAAGVPLVATAISDLPELLEGAAVLVPPGDGDALVEGCLRLLDDAGARADLARRGEALVRGRLSVESAVETHARRYFG